MRVMYEWNFFDSNDGVGACPERLRLLGLIDSGVRSERVGNRPEAAYRDRVITASIRHCKTRHHPPRLRKAPSSIH